MCGYQLIRENLPRSNRFFVYPPVDSYVMSEQEKHEDKGRNGHVYTAAWVSIIGRPSSGKSTLLNALCGRKIAITAPSPQTTRNKIRGILNRPQGQLVFVDTPGYHTSDKKVNIYLRDLAVSALDESDLILYVIDATRPPGEEEAQIAELLKPLSEKVVCFYNKTDLVQNPNPDAFSSARRGLVSGSALTGEGVDTLTDLLFSLSPEGDPLYPPEFYTDQVPEFRIGEIIREKAVNKLRDELPHALYVEIADMEEHEGTLWVRAFIMVERESQKGIVVGKQGATLGAVRKEALKELGEIFEHPIKLDLRVKAHPKWRKKDPLLKRLIH